MKKTLSFLPLFFLVLALTATCVSAYAYEHDPRLDPSAMADIVFDPTAVYGFAPSPEGSLSIYTDFDWTDEELVNGEDGRLARIAYHESLDEMYILLDDMKADGFSLEEIARAVSTKRNEIRLASYGDNAEGLATAKARNLERYGHEEGPLPDELYEQYGSWEEVLWKAFSANSGMDACLGLYDEYYPLYVASGKIDDERETPATREYAAAVLAEAFALASPEESDALGRFSDAGEIAAWYAPSIRAAVTFGVLRGYEDGTFRPGQALTLAEACAMLARCLPDAEAAADSTAETAAIEGVPAWASGEIAALSAAGLLPETDLGWNDPLTVSEFRTLILAAAVKTAG
ncbi:MAG: S-layer homology domain-containing protein [Clostridia bacterium]|nr:S-layer homology domain-containing protein [Clostridia bacterium]